MPTINDLASAQVSSSQPGLNPGAVDQSFPTVAGTPMQSLWSRRDFLVEAHRGWHERVNQVVQIANGEWYRVWPDLTREPLAPTVANIVELGITHIGTIGGSTVPSVKIPVPHVDKGPEGERGASKRERRVRELREQSNYPVLLANSWQDYAGSGSAIMGVWVNFEEEDTAKRNPYYMRFDPRHTFPVKDQRGNITELLVARRRVIYDLEREYPQLKGKFSKDADVEEWFWYTPDRFRHILADISKDGRAKNSAFVITNEENKLGRIPAVEIARPTFDGERRGQFDQVIHILRTMHHLMALTIERTEEEVYPAVGGYEVEGLEKFGPGAVMQYRSSDSKIDILSPKNMFDVKDLIARLEENARSQALYPQQLSGEPGASIVSARGIGASQGALNSALALIHRQFEWGLAVLDGLALHMDEIYCEGKKTIYGDARDRKNPESFVPSRDIAGDYEVVVSYGLGAGSDPANREIRMQMHLSTGLVSRARAREELDFLEDPEEQEIQRAKESTMDALLQGLLAMAQQGQPGPALTFLKILRDPSTSLEEKLEELMEAMSQQQPGAAPPGGPAGPGGPQGLEVPAAAESLARGGVPGNAEGLSGMALPGLPSILGPDSPRQVS